MLTFHPLSLADKPRIDRHVFAEDSRSADFNFGNMFLWDEKYKQLVADSDHHLIVLCHAYAQPAFPFPIGCGDPAAAIDAMREYAVANGFPLVICGLERRHVTALESLFPGSFDFSADRDSSDYIYEAESLRTLTGKKLHGKRNHINRFTSEHDWRFTALTPELFPACRSLLEFWAADADNNHGSADSERRAIERAFRYYDVLGLQGGALFAEDRLVAFSIGEKISSDTFDVHFEKARADINGAYPMINREFVKMLCQADPTIRYVNREDDMGLANLRKSKESYAPAFLLEKYTARWRDNA